MRFALFGAGRAGTIHARNIAAHPRAELAYIFDVDQAAAQRLTDARLLHSARQNLTDERRTLILAWHRRRDEVWDKPPAYWQDEIPEVLANRDANREYARSRIPGEHLEFSGQ